MQQSKYCNYYHLIYVLYNESFESIATSSIDQCVNNDDTDSTVLNNERSQSFESVLVRYYVPLKHKLPSQWGKNKVAFVT